METAVIYARYSSDNQRDESIDAQVRACRAYAAQHDLDIVHVYADRAFSGTTDNRPQFQEMIKAAKRHAFQVVLVHKLDRFSRDRLTGRPLPSGQIDGKVCCALAAGLCLPFSGGLFPPVIPITGSEPP